MNRNDRAGGVGELLGNEHSGTSILEHEEKERVPDNALEDNNLDHERSGKFSVHAFEERNAHNEGVGQRGEGEESNGPFETATLADFGPDGEDGEDDELLESVGGYETEVHGVRVIG